MMAVTIKEAGETLKIMLRSSQMVTYKLQSCERAIKTLSLVTKKVSKGRSGAEPTKSSSLQRSARGTRYESRPKLARRTS